MLKGMFKSAVSKFVDTVSVDDSLLPVPDLVSASHLKPLKVVVKKKPNHFWQTATYQLIKDVSLGDLLTADSAGSLTEVQPDRTFVKFNQTHLHVLAADAGVKFSKLLNNKVKKSTYVEVTATFGEVVMKEVNEFKLMNALRERKIDINNAFVREVRQNRQKVLCVVVGTASLKDGGSLCTTKEKSTDESVRGGQQLVAQVQEEVSNENTSEKAMQLPPGTTLAFYVCELLVRADGGLRLVVERDCEGGFERVAPRLHK